MHKASESLSKVFWHCGYVQRRAGLGLCRMVKSAVFNDHLKAELECMEVSKKA